MSTEQILIPNPSRYHNFIEVSSDNTIIVIFSRNSETNENCIFYSTDSGDSYTYYDYSSETYTILGTTSFTNNNTLYVFYYTSYVNSNNDLSSLKYVTITTTGLTTNTLYKVISSCKYFSAISVNSKGTAMAVSAFRGDSINAYQICVSRNTTNINNLVTQDSQNNSPFYTNNSYVKKITQVSISDINDGLCYLGLFSFTPFNNIYCFGNASGSTIYTTTLDNTTEDNCTMSNITYVNNSSTYVAILTYNSTNGGSAKICIYLLQKSNNQLKKANTASYIFEDTYHTFLSINKICLLDNNQLVCSDNTGFTYFNNSTPYRYFTYNYSTNSVISCAISMDSSNNIYAYALNSTPYLFKTTELVCFLETTSITILENNIEIEKNIELLKKGTLVKVNENTYKSINYIGYQLININNNLKYLSVLKKDSISENIPYKNLYITTGHSLLFPDLKYSNNFYNQNVYDNNIENYYKIMAQHCVLCENVTKDEIKNLIINNKYVKVYHFSLEHENNDGQYAVYSNGVRSECMSYNYAINYCKLNELENN